jgi:hypothetical protein
MFSVQLIVFSAFLKKITLLFHIDWESKSYENLVTSYALKGQCHEIFDPRFFHQNIRPGLLIKGLKPFRI